MKVVALGQAKNSLSAYVDEAQRGRILVTRHGKPAALIIGVAGEELEDLMTRSDPEFWRMIEARRKAATSIPAGEMPGRAGGTPDGIERRVRARHGDRPHGFRRGPAGGLSCRR